MKLKALIAHTFRELLAKATLLVLVGISTLIILFLAIALSAKTANDGAVVTLLGNDLCPLLPYDKFKDFVLMMQAGFANGLYSGIVLFGIFATAGIIPEMLEKGTVDLYLSKPIARWELLFGKYSGAVVVMFANVLFFIGAMWLVTGIKLGVWNSNFLLSSVTLTFTFTCLYTIVVFFGVWSRNTAISIIGAFVYLFVVSPLLFNREQTLYLFLKSDVSHKIVDFLYYMLPQISDMQKEMGEAIIRGSINWRPFVQSGLSGAAIFLGASELLKRKDF